MQVWCFLATMQILTWSANSHTSLGSHQVWGTSQRTTPTGSRQGSGQEEGDPSQHSTRQQQFLTLPRTCHTLPSPSGPVLIQNSTGPGVTSFLSDSASLPPYAASRQNKETSESISHTCRHRPQVLRWCQWRCSKGKLSSRNELIWDDPKTSCSEG